MKLAAIYNVWDGEEHLTGSINCIKDRVDAIIIVFQNISNFGELHFPLGNLKLPEAKYFFHEYKPTQINGAFNEKRKRNIGLEIAKQNGFTHFIHLDCDEYYKDFGKAKEAYINSGRDGSACKIYTYFKLATLRFETEDGYFVPFIHKLKPDSCAGSSEYPYYVDPTRRINEKNVALLDIHMHHFSWVRKNIERKVRNSSAKFNLERGTMLKDYNNPSVCHGFYVKDYDKKLIEVNNYFNITL